MGEHVQKLSDAQGNISDEDRDKHVFLVPQDVRQDLLLVAMLIADTYVHPLPIMDPDSLLYTYTLLLVGTWGKKSSPSLGILFPLEDMQQVGADSLPFPTDFLLKANGICFVANTSSTLEALGTLTPLMAGTSVPTLTTLP